MRRKALESSSFLLFLFPLVYFDLFRSIGPEFTVIWLLPAEFRRNMHPSLEARERLSIVPASANNHPDDVDSNTVFTYGLVIEATTTDMD